jgi:uncharacterized membrane protein YraQ (UPF0718 family)
MPVNRRAGVLHGLLTADRGVTSNLSNPQSGDYPGFEFFKCNIALKLRECRDNNHRPPPDQPQPEDAPAPIVGPLVAVISFVCSVGNIPLAAVLWNGGISFGGVIAFIFADLIILPILNIYRKYYGLRMAGFLFVTFYAAMAGAALIVELIFAALGLVPAQRNARVAEASLTWNYTTWLNIVFLLLAALLVGRFLKTGGPAMLRMMNRPAAMGHSH